MYFGKDTLICTLMSVRWLYFDEDTLICTLPSVRWLYFDEDTLICTLLSVRCLYFVGAVTQRSRGLLCGMICLRWLCLTSVSLGLTAVSLGLTAVSLSLTVVKSCWSHGLVLLRSQITI